MQETTIKVLIHAFYLVALINPVSKVSVVSVMDQEEKQGAIKYMTTKASVVAILILLGAMVAGDFILRKVFGVQLHSLGLAGGVVFFYVGFNALRNGVFFGEKMSAKYSEAALVPLACPMIAGPATIAACITPRTQEGLLVTSLAVILAVLVNYIAMRSSKLIVTALSRFNIMGAIIRLTGLIVMTIGVQMGLNSISKWLETL